MFETQSPDTRQVRGEIGLNIRTLASPKVGQDQVSGGVSVLCWLAAKTKTAMTAGEWSYLISIARAPPTCKEGREAKNEKFKRKYMSPPDIESPTLCILAGHLDHLAIVAVEYLCFKLLQYSEVTGNAWGVTKHVAIQLIKSVTSITCHFTLLDEFKYTGYQMPRCPSCLGVRLECKG